MSRVEDLKQQIEELENKTKELQKKLEIERQKKEIDYPFNYPLNYSETCYLLRSNSVIVEDWWSSSGNDRNCYKQGNLFKTKEEAQKERDKRELLMRFRQFRDKCNGDWKPEFDDFLQDKYTIRCDYGLKELFLFGEGRVYEFSLFGYFKNGDDCKRAIELFGDEIIRLWADE